MELSRNRFRNRDASSLLSTRQGTFAVALSCALIAAGILIFAIDRYRHSVTNSSKEARVLVASAVIQKGTSADIAAAQQLLSPTRILEKQVSGGAIADIATVRGKVAVRDIYPGQQLTAADFTTSVGTASNLAPYQRAVSIPLDQSHGLGGVLQTGDHVDVYAGFPAQNGGAPVVRLLGSNVLVLQAASATGGIGGTQNGNVVLAVDQKLAPSLAFVSDNGKIWLVLRPGNASATTQAVATQNSILTAAAVSSSASGTGPAARKP